MFSSIFDIEFNPNKHIVHLDRISNLALGKDAFPVTLELDVSSRCNHKCNWCVDPPGAHSARLLPVSMAEGILKEARKLGIKGVVFKGGGESTLHPDFAAIIRMAAENKFEIGIVTNGGNLNNPGLLSAIVQYVAYLRISIDGPTPESRRDIHGVDDFSGMTEGLRKLIVMKQSQRHPVVGATFCLDYPKRLLIDKCITLGEELNLDYILIRPPFCEEVGFPAPHSPQEAAILKEEIRRAAKAHRGQVPVMAGNWTGDKELEVCLPGKKDSALARRDLSIRQCNCNGIEHITGRCLASPLFLVVTAGGEVYGCCCLRGIREFTFGTIDYDSNVTLASILKGEQRKRSLAKMRRVECLKHCTHPLAKINELIEYLALPEKYHSSFI